MGDDQEGEPDTERGPGQAPSAPREQDEGRRPDHSLRRESREGERDDLVGPGRGEEREPGECGGGDTRHGDRHGAQAGRGRHQRLRAAPPQPEDIPAEGLGQQGEREHRCRPGDRGRPGSGDRDDKGDVDGGRDDLAPVAEIERSAQPRQNPAGDAEDIAREADRQHPPPDRLSRDDGQREDGEGVDLPVEPASERRHRVRMPRHRPVHGVQQERGNREDEDRPRVGRTGQALRGEGRDTAPEEGATIGEGVGGPQAPPIRTDAGDHDEGQEGPAREPDEPAGPADAGPRVEGREEGDEQRRTDARSHHWGPEPGAASGRHTFRGNGFQRSRRDGVHGGTASVTTPRSPLRWRSLSGACRSLFNRTAIARK